MDRKLSAKAPKRASTWVRGEASGDVLWTDVALSFWGGVNPRNGVVIDEHHPLHGRTLKDRILVLPGSRGSCTGSVVMLELLLGGHAPKALVLAGRDDTLMLGVLVAEAVFGRSIPVISVDDAYFRSLKAQPSLRVRAGAAPTPGPVRMGDAIVTADQSHFSDVRLDEADLRMLQGHDGKATQVAMDIIVRMARAAGATQLLDIQQAHVDGCIYTGPASLSFARQLLSWGARVKISTTMNAISVDRCGWRSMRVPPALGAPAEALAQAYLDMGVAPTYTCAPYYLDSSPRFGDQIAWAESNAVIYANSVIGARTAKYPDFLDIFIALTGRAAAADTHLTSNRRATLRVDVDVPPGYDDSLWPLLGYLVGACAGRAIPVVNGLQAAWPTLDDLRAFGAAFATTSSAPMFHIAGITPEAPDLAAALGGEEPVFTHRITAADLCRVWQGFNRKPGDRVELVALGNPHLSPREITALAVLCEGRQKSAAVEMAITTSRDVLHTRALAGSVAALRRFGARFIVDTCWCVIQDPIIDPSVRTVMTNSGKYAHYGPGLIGRDVRFGSLADCVEAARSGKVRTAPPDWLAAG